MGIFFSKATKAVIDKNRVATSYFITGACFLLIAANVAVFLFIPKIMLPLAVVLSNAVTVILMLLAVQPINNLIQREFAKKASQLLEQQQEEQALKDRVVELEHLNSELERRIDTWAQTTSVPANINLSFKVETMTYSKSGYIVKEEPLDRFLDDPAYKLADKTGFLDKLTKWLDSLSHPGEKKVLYIGKYYIKASIGIDFTHIKFSVQDGVLTLFGVRFTKLNDLAITRDEDEVNHCWLLNETSVDININPSEFYREFTEAYSEYREKEAQELLEKEVQMLCERYTEVFRSNLVARFPGIEFCDHIESSPATWYSLKEHMQDERVFPIASNMLLMADVLSGTTDAWKLLGDA
jgi:hypothetical protein